MGIFNSVVYTHTQTSLPETLCDFVWIASMQDPHASLAVPGALPKPEVFPRHVIWFPDAAETSHQANPRAEESPWPIRKVDARFIIRSASEFWVWPAELSIDPCGFSSYLDEDWGKRRHRWDWNRSNRNQFSLKT